MKRKKQRRVSLKRQIEPGELQEKDSTIDSGAEVEPDAERKENVSRRRFLLGGTGLAAAAILAGDSLVEAQKKRPGSGQGGGGGGQGQGGGGGGGGRGGGGGGGRPRVQSALNFTSSATSPPFSEPKVVTPRVVDGRSTLNLTLDCELTSWNYQCEGEIAKASIPIFNQDVPGPTMLVDPGTTLNLVLKNGLPTKSGFDDPCESGGMQGMSKQVVSKPSETQPECFMHTNLHTHGLWVSPCSLNQDGTTHCGPYAINGTNPPLKSSSDDVLLDIFPGQTNNYCIALPDFHDPGTYWYHSHVHGSSAYQVSSGMAGAIIIREPPGEELVPADRDMVFLMQEIIFNPPPPPPPAPQYKNIPLVYQEKSTTEGSAGFLINGQCKPTLQIKTGQNYRWRFINGTGTPRGLMKLRLIKISDNPAAVVQDSDVFDQGTDPVAPGTIIFPVKQKWNNRNAYMHLIAVDGLTFYGFSPQPVQRHLIAPGNRADFIINIPKTAPPGGIGGPGKYVLVKDAFPKDGVSFELQPSLDCSEANQKVVNQTVPASMRTNQVLAYIEVQQGFTTEPIPSLPKNRPLNLQPIATVDRHRTGANAIAFQGIGGGAAGGGGGAGGGNFFINCKVYDPQSPGIVAQLNTAEEWELQNYGATDFPHPFHIHVNPFQIVGRTIDFETDNPTLAKDNPCNWIWQDTVAIPATIPPFSPKTCPAPSPTPTPRPTPTPTPRPTPTPAASPTPIPCPPAPTDPGSVNIRTRFLVYPGEYVIHCHILIHEDVGMMSNVTIEDPTGVGIGPCRSLAAPTQAAVDCVNKTKPKTNC